jgi:hypothetical protein
MLTSPEERSCLACGSDALATIRDDPPYSHAIAFYAPTGRFSPVVALLCRSCSRRFASDRDRNRFLESAFLQQLRSSLRTSAIDCAC